ncbi:MAG: hypothetical protein JXM69_18440 [Anaerolineae bacterium]|nr:hypothetical protein [Anaerolineae bacterium]
MTRLSYLQFLLCGSILLTACSAVESGSAGVKPEESPPPVVAQSEEPGVENAGIAQKDTPTTPTTEEIMVPKEDIVAETEPTAEATTPEMITSEKTSPVTAEIDPRPTTGQLQLLANLPVLGRPAELNNEVWLNSEPLHLADLQGKVVIIEFWTYG